MQIKSAWPGLTAFAFILAFAFLSPAQSADRPEYRIGMLSNNVGIDADSGVSQQLEAGLAALGYKDGDIEWIRRPAKRDHNLLDKYAAELVRMKPTLIIGGDTTASKALKAATAKDEDKIPVVFWSLDPVEAGVVETYERPGGNFTGTADAPDTQRRELVFLKTVTPDLKKIGMLYNPTYAPAPAALRNFQREAADLGLEVTPYETLTIDAFEKSIKAMKADGVQAMVVGPHSLFSMNGEKIGELALKYRLPTASVVGSVLRGGGVCVFGPDFSRIWFDQAQTVDRILKGEDPAGIPVKRPPAAMSINLKAAKSLGLDIPESLIEDARRVIE